MCKAWESKRCRKCVFKCIYDKKSNEFWRCFSLLRTPTRRYENVLMWRILTENITNWTSNFRPDYLAKANIHILSYHTVKSWHLKPPLYGMWIHMKGCFTSLKAFLNDQQRWDVLDSITDSLDMNMSQLWEIVNDRGAWHAAVHGVAKSRTWLSDWTTVAWLTNNSSEC